MGLSSSTTPGFHELTKLEEELIALQVRNLLAQPYYHELDELKTRLVGHLLLPSDDGLSYGQARCRPYNLDQRGYPCVIIRVKSVEDVSNCLNFVNKYRDSINLCIAGGCHSSKCMITGSFVIDLFYLSKVTVNHSNGTVTVEGGAHLKDMDEALAPYGLATPSGSYSMTGIGGLTMAGGYGWLTRQLGLTVDSLREIEIVLYDGSVVIANDDCNPELIWAIRGGGGNFGIVTKFTFQTYQLPRSCFGGTVRYLTPSIASTKALLRNYDILVQNVSHRIGSNVSLSAGGYTVTTLWSYLGDAQLQNEISDFVATTSLGGWAVIENSFRSMSYHLELQRMTSSVVTSGHIYQSVVPVGNHLTELPDEFLDELLLLIFSKPAASIAKAVVSLNCLGGACAFADDGSKTSISIDVRQSRYFAIIEAHWKPEYGEDGKQAARQWAKEVYDVLNKYRSGMTKHAPDELSIKATEGENSFSIQDTNQLNYSDKEILKKLSIIKAKYDPQNLFHNNANVLPEKRINNFVNDG